MRVDEGELLLYRCADEIDTAGKAGDRAATAHAGRMRVDCAVGVRRCLEAVEILFTAAGPPASAAPRRWPGRSPT